MFESFPLIDLDGDADARGLRYGREAGERIAKGLDIYREDFARRGTDWEEALSAADRYLPALERFDREMSLELTAIARGAEQPVSAIVLLNARSELGIDPVTEECTVALALANATAERHVLHGQNWDWRPGCVETAVVLRIAAEDGHQMLVFCEAGQLARHGMNNAGLALTANGLQTPDDNARKGVPTPIIRRRLLMQSTLADAAGVVFGADRSCSYALTVSHRDGEAYCFEATPRQLFWLLPENDIFSHANHFKDVVARMTVDDVSLRRHPESLYRDRRTLAGLQKAHGRITRSTFEEIFADTYGWPHSICRPPTERADGATSATVATLIMDTTAGNMWIAPAPYEGATYAEYGFA